MRKDVVKYLVVGLEKERATFFRLAQEAGVMEFIGVPTHPLKEVETNVNLLLNAIKILRGVPLVKQREGGTLKEALQYAQQVIGFHQQIETLRESNRFLTQEIARVQPFGYFSREEITRVEREGKCLFQFFHAKQGVHGGWNEEDSLLHITTENGLDYFLAINQERRGYEGLVEMQIEQPAHVLKERCHLNEQEIHRAEKELKGLAHYNAFLHQMLLTALDALYLEQTKASVEGALEGSLFTIEGWIPQGLLLQLQTKVASLAVDIQEIVVEEKDRVPTYLHNEGMGKVGEDLVRIYDTPSISDRDPSLWVLFSFALFFGMIINDAGYGLLFLAGALYWRWRHAPKKKGAKRFLKLCLLLFTSCILWGTLVSSFFGVDWNPDNPLVKHSLIAWLREKKAAYHIAQCDDVYTAWVKQFPQLKGECDPHQFLRGGVTISEGKTTYVIEDRFDDEVLFELALFVGTLHLLLSLLRYANRHWAAWGWVIFLISGYLYFPFMLGAASLLNYVFGIPSQVAGIWGFYGIYTGIGLASGLALWQKRWGGLAEVMTVIQLFGDVLSYLRLYALGLAGGIVAVTFNEMALASGIFFGPLILIAGHLVNIVLGVMSGVIHGLRLNFLEWYHYSFEGGGKLFHPLALTSHEH